MVAPTGTRSVQDVLTYVFRQFGDESGVQIDAEDVIRWINQGQMELVSKNPIIQAVAGAFFDTKRQGYKVPDDCIQLEAVVWSTDQTVDEYPVDPSTGFQLPNIAGRPLKAVDMSEGLRQRESVGVTGEPQSWYIWGNTIYLVPQPSQFTYPLRIYYAASPGYVATAGDLLGIPDRYYDKLLMFVMSKAYELDQDWQAHSIQRDKFESEMANLNFAETSTQGSYPTIRSTNDGYYY